jgi:EpsD family peptidyl-prolyl cis-trans isomerase
MSMSNKLVPLMTAQRFKQSAWVLVLIATVGLSACGNKDKKAGQSLAVVNGEEITFHQVKEELQRANVPAAQQEAASKQLLEALIERQLLLAEAAKDKTDRDPKVMQAVERSRAQIIAQAYMQKRLGTVAKPSKAEVEAYFKKNPQFFSERKQFDLKQLTIASKSMNDQLRTSIDAAKSLEDVAAYLTSNKIEFGRGDLVRSTSDLPTEMSSKLLSMPRTQLFLIKEGERTLLLSLTDVKDSPVTLEKASPQIEQFLFQQKTKETAEGLLKSLRATAKINYLNGAGSASAKASANASANAAASAGASADAEVKKGMEAGFK